MTDLAFDAHRLPTRRLSPGEMVGGRYRLERFAGAGGMATVWRACDERLQRTVAIKVISDALAVSPEGVARFAREARTHAGIQHPNLVQVYDYSISAAPPYLVMEYVDGATLSETLDRGAFTAGALETLTVELLSAIACVHDHGVLHRDIKCANVLLDGQGHARLTDFGLARLEDSSRITRIDEVVGTLRFLAPELIEGQAPSRQSDLFALGILLRTAAAHAAPSPQLSNLIRWLTQPDAGERPPDAHAVLSLLTEGPTEVQPVVRRAHTTREAPTTRMSREPSTTRMRRELPTTRVRREAPTPRLRRPQQPRRLAARLRNRLIASLALLVAVVGTALAVTIAQGGSGPVRRPAAAVQAPGRRAVTAPSRRMRTADQQLQRLAADVRAAAKPRA